MIHSRKRELATIVMTPIARWNRLTTWNVRDVSTRDVARAICPEAESDVIDALECAVNVG